VPGPSEWFGPVATLLSGVTNRWALAGALAALNYRRVPRGTTDVDVLIEWSEALVPALERAGYEVRQIVDPSVGHPHLLICRRGEERVDLIIPTVPYQENAIDRAEDHTLSVEDVIVHKLIAWRPRDQEDVASILAAGHELDTEYIEHWAAEWEVSDRWREAIGS
jgi:hypothetical protein